MPLAWQSWEVFHRICGGKKSTANNSIKKQIWSKYYRGWQKLKFVTYKYVFTDIHKHHTVVPVISPPNPAGLTSHKWKILARRHLKHLPFSQKFQKFWLKSNGMDHFSLVSTRIFGTTFKGSPLWLVLQVKPNALSICQIVKTSTEVYAKEGWFHCIRWKSSRLLGRNQL